MIDIRTFNGEVPKLSEKLLPGEYATTAKNCNLESGNLRPMKGVVSEQAVDGGAETIYRLGENWLQWNNKINIIESLVQNSNGRILFTGDEYPKETDISLALTTAPYPTATRRLGLAAPSTALTDTVTSAGSSGTTIDISYCYTRVGKWADDTYIESAPSPATDVRTVNDDAVLDLSGFSVDSSDGAYTTHYNIYRINTGDTGAEYQFLEQVAYDDTFPWEDDLSVTEPQEVLPTEGWTVPPEDLEGLIATSNGQAFGFVGNTVYVCEPFYGYTFPIAYSLSVGSDVIGLGYNGTAVAVLTKTVPFLIYGSEPESLSVEKLPFQFPCTSARSIVSIPGGVVYASANGLVLINSDGEAVNITEEVFTQEQWREINSPNSFSFFFNNAYIIFFADTNLGIEIKPGSQEIRRFQTESFVYGGQYVSTVSINTYTLLDSAGNNFLTSDGYQFLVRGSEYTLTYDTLYIIQSTETAREIVAWEAGDLVDYTWGSKIFHTPDHEINTAGMVIGDFTNGSVTFDFYVDGELHLSKSISNEEIFRIPPKRGLTFQIFLTGKATVDRIIIGGSAQEVVRSSNG